jgi:TonB family protein
MVAATAFGSAVRAVKTRIAPTYPELAKRLRITGTVKVEATVDADGKETAVTALSGSKVLMQAAEDAVAKWKFAAGSAASTEEVDVNFALGQ